MKPLRLTLVALAVAGTWLASMGTAQTCQGQVLLNEILADPGVDWDGNGTISFKDDEWVEIVNAGPVPLPLDDYRLSDGGTPAMRFGFGGTLPPGGVKVVYGSMSVAWETAQGLSTVGLSLNNAGDDVRLWKIAGTDTILVDSYTYASFEVLDDRSTGRMPDGTSEWRLFDARNPYSGTIPPLGTGCNPTPGASNSCPTPVEPVTWGTVKHLYQSH
jgi:hypothetical protein